VQAQNSRDQRLSMINNADVLSIQHQCSLLGIARSSYYHGLSPRTESLDNLAIMLEMDKLYFEFPYFGARRMLTHLSDTYKDVNIKRIRRLMRLMGLKAIYPEPKTSIANKEHKKYPYLLRNVVITHPNHVWSTDITYIPMPNGFMYLCAVMDWYSRMILSWSISNTMTVEFCVEVLEDALAHHPKPAIFNSDQGSQFTSNAFTKVLKDNEVQISMDGVRRAIDNVYIERFWRDIKYNCIYINAFDTVPMLYDGIEEYMYKHCYRQKHSSLGNQFPATIYKGGII
jgi:putative transposase